jgi:chromosome segregation ATPase
MHGEEIVETEDQKNKVKTSAPRDVNQAARKKVKRTSSKPEDYDRVLNPLPPPSKGKPHAELPRVVLVEEDISGIESPSLLKEVLKTIVRTRESMKDAEDPQMEEEIRQLEEKNKRLRAEDEELEKSIQECADTERMISRVTSKILKEKLPPNMKSNEQELEEIVKNYERKKSEISELSETIKLLEQQVKEKEKLFSQEREVKLEKLQSYKAKRVEVGKTIEDTSKQIRGKDSELFQLTDRLERTNKISANNLKTIESKNDRTESLKRQVEEKDALLKEKKLQHEIKLEAIKKNRTGD